MVGNRNNINEMEDEVQEAIQKITDGTLASQIKKNMKFATTGMILGGVIGIGIASFTGRCRLCFGFWGALAGGGIGYLTSGKTIDVETTDGKTIEEKTTEKIPT